MPAPISLTNLSKEQSEKNHELIQQQNQIIKQWLPKIRRSARSKTTNFSHGKTKPFEMRGKDKSRRENKLFLSINTKAIEKDGVIFGVSIKFERHGIFVLKGTGRGYSAKGGGLERNKARLLKIMKNKDLSIHKKINARVVRRSKFDWINPPLDQIMPEFVDAIAKINADILIKSTANRINGNAK
jgi:hypothetical protein